MNVLLKVFLVSQLIGFLPLHQQQVTYISQPEQAAIFFNNIAYVHDTLTIIGDSEVQIQLPAQTFIDTLILEANGERVRNYRVRNDGNGFVLYLGSVAETSDISLEYLLSGLSWKPTYDMEILETDQVELDFFVEIQNSALELDAADITLVAGRVDTSQQLDAVSQAAMNQVIVGYDNVSVDASINTGAVTIQHVYPMGEISAEVGDVIYAQISSAELAARRLLVWNASQGNEVTVIYKIANNTDVPLAEGVVRSYQNGLFIGSDGIETTPIGSEGSVTVGGLQNVRVRRTQSQTAEQGIILGGDYDYRFEVTLQIENFSEEAVSLEIVDTWPYNAQNFDFSLEPNFEGDNLLRWQVEIPAEESLTIRYEYLTD